MMIMMSRIKKVLEEKRIMIYKNGRPVNPQDLSTEDIDKLIDQLSDKDVSEILEEEMQDPIGREMIEKAKKRLRAKNGS